MLDYGIIFVNVFSDQSSATDGLSIQQSADGTNWDNTDEYTVPANTGKTFSFQPSMKYLRVVYTNGATPQTAFRLQTVLKKTNSLPSSHRIKDSIIDDDDATLQKSVLTGKTSAGNFINFGATNGGNFKVSIEELESGVSDDSNASLKVSPYITDEYGEVARLLGDNIFQGALITIPVEHHEIHCGDSYEAMYHVDLANGATQDFLIVVPNETGTGQDQKLYHCKCIMDSEAEVSVSIYEGATASANGTAITSVNRNRNSTNTDTLGIYHTPTITSVGTLLWGPWHLGSAKTIGGNRSRDSEYVLKNNTVYLVRIINQTTGVNYINVEFDYYVHPGI